MSNPTLAGWAASSNPATPDEISNRVKGVVLALSSVIIYIAAQVFNLTLTPADMIEVATSLGTIAGAVITLYGAGLALVRKFARAQ